MSALESVNFPRVITVIWPPDLTTQKEGRKEEGKKEQKELGCCSLASIPPNEKRVKGRKGVKEEGTPKLFRGQNHRERVQSRKRGKEEEEEEEEEVSRICIFWLCPFPSPKPHFHSLFPPFLAPWRENDFTAFSFFLSSSPLLVKGGVAKRRREGGARKKKGTQIRKGEEEP